MHRIILLRNKKFIQWLSYKIMEQSIRGQVSSTPPESEPHLKIPPILWEAIQVLPQESPFYVINDHVLGNFNVAGILQ